MKVSLNKKLKPFATQQSRYKIAYGGRGSGKSWSIARILLLIASSRKIRVLCCREIQNSIKDSVHKLLKDQIDEMELQGFIVQNDSIRHTNGSEFIFTGLYSNISKIKSLEGIDKVWVEEGESISAASWEVLDPTIRKPNSEIWVSFNPRCEHDIMYTTFIINTPENAIVIKVNWQDNKYFPKELSVQKDRMMRTDPDKYLHIWEGQLKKNTDEQVLNNKWAIEEFTAPDKTHFYFGADWGFSNDPNTLVRCYIDKHKEYGDNCLYIDYEANDRPYDEDVRNTSSDMDMLPELWETVPLVRDYPVYADSARPETIAHMVKHGFNVLPSKKGAGSVEDGVSYIRSFDKVIIHPRCKNTIHEAKYYSYKVDKASGQVTNKILDKCNHMMDGLRYSLADARLNTDTWWN